MSYATVRNTQPQDIILELKSFIEGVNQSSKCNQFELAKTALSLLKTLPATRDAVLSYFCTVFNTATLNFVVRIETEIATGQLPPVSEEDETIVSEIHTVICNFVSLNPEAWAPIISTWSLELLGELSTKYAGRAHVSTVGVNETLQLWMSCRSTRTLIDITTLCLSSLIHLNTEACINALLDTSVKHSPNFDWVVAHVGSCFPTTVITRVLSCGLKDFCQNKSYEQGSDSAKLKSVVGILGHLVVSHCDDICTALFDLFNWSLETEADLYDVKLQKKKTVPFLLQLAFLSPTLLLAISKNIEHTLPTEVVIKLPMFIDDWIKYFGSTEALRDFIVHLIMKCTVGGVQIIKILLGCIFLESFPTIQNCGKEILEYVLQEIDLLLRKKIQQPSISIEVLDSFLQDISEVNNIILSPEFVKSQTAAKLIMFLGKFQDCMLKVHDVFNVVGHSNPSVLVKSCIFLFENAKTDEHLAFLIKILTNELLDKTKEPYSTNGGHFGVVLNSILSKPLYAESQTCNVSKKMLNNLLTLLQWEKSNKVPMLRSKLISRAIYVSLGNITKLLGSNLLENDILHIVANLLDLLDVPSLDPNYAVAISLQEIINFINAAVNYFFVCCKESDDFKKIVGLKCVYGMFKRLSVHSKVAKMIALRELVERGVFTKDKVLFGSQNEVTKDLSDYGMLLVDQNRKNIKTIPLTKNSSTLNGGIIGNGRRSSIEYEKHPEDVVAENVQHFIKALTACCALPLSEENKNIDLSLDSLTNLSLLLVQFVSPDVMYNGLPWPEEEFCKVTIERDFYIRRLFNNNPLLWDILSFVALYRPALCYCSVLLRAITATLIQQWSGTSDQNKITNTDKYNSIMDVTIKVIDVMSLGQLLLPPLSGIRDVIPYLKCSEIVQILRDCVWCYMRDHVPSPALFNCDSSGVYWRDPALARPPDIYVTTLRVIMQNNISKVGHLYAHMFTNIPSID